MTFFWKNTTSTAIYTVSLHDALPISVKVSVAPGGETSVRFEDVALASARKTELTVDRKSTRLNSSHGYISYAVFCLKKKIGAGDPEAPVDGDSGGRGSGQPRGRGPGD